MRTGEGVISAGDTRPAGNDAEVGSDDISSSPSATSRPMRADAVKNRRRILEVAEAVFATEGVSVPIDTVAERAGVGVGTLYRHFPTKETLFEAIVMLRLQELIETATAHSEDADPADALFAFLREFAQQASAKRDLFEAMNSAGFDIKSQCSEMVEQMKRQVEHLRQRAVDSGEVRSDVSTEEMIGLLSGACQAVSHGEPGDLNVQRMVEVVFDGLRTPASARP